MEKKNYIINNKRLISEWDWEKNSEIGLQPDRLTVGSDKKAYWVCEKGHSWQATIANRDKGQGCPYCAGKRVLCGFNDLATVSPEVAIEWNHKRNQNIKPSDVTKGSSKRVWWICSECGHEWQTSVANRVKGTGCPICSKRKQGKKKVENIIKNEGSFADNYPELLADWDYKKNKVSPYCITSKSRELVWWKCHVCGYEWEVEVSYRTVRKHRCPSCANKVATPENCISKTHPHVLKLWNYERNNTITPEQVTYGSNKKVWWKCEKGHEWVAKVDSIIRGGRCPICSGQKVLRGYNDLSTIRPDIAKEWHPYRNEDLTPDQLTYGSNKKVWWLCPKGHEYQAKVNNRTKGTGCPICNKERKTSFPEQTILYYFKKVFNAESRFLIDGKTEIDIYLPDYKVGIEYDGFYYHHGAEAKRKERKKDALLESLGVRLIRVKEIKDSSLSDTDNIIFCVNNGGTAFIEDVLKKLAIKVGSIIKKDIIFDINISRDIADIYSQYINLEKENSLFVKNPKLAKEWHPNKNGLLTPEKISYSSGKKVWWLCDKGHEYQATVDSRRSGNGCPICAGQQLLKGFNDLATTHPELLSEWCYEMNADIDPSMISIGTKKKVWWKCDKGHIYQSTPSNKASGRGCPYCSNKKVLLGYNDLESQYPEIASEWNYEKNSENPSQIVTGSNKKVWWKCKTCGHEWQQTPNHRVYRNTGCPGCSGRVATELQNLAITNPLLCEEWDREKNEKSPSDYRANSNKKVWWKCNKCGYSWLSTIGDRNNGTGCPACVGKVVVKGFNDLATTHPELLSEWCYEKNKEIDPYNVIAGSHKKAWWVCSVCGHQWEASIANRSRGRGCPECARRKTAKSKQKVLYQYDLDGHYINKYSSREEAINASGVKHLSVANDNRVVSGGYIWLHEYNLAKAKELSKSRSVVNYILKNTPVLQYTLAGEFIKKHKNSGEAEQINNIGSSKVGACCRGKRKTAGGYIWKYER